MTDGIQMIAPNPRLVRLMDFAVTEVAHRLHDKPEYRNWLAWAHAWMAGERSPGRCVEVAQGCVAHHCLAGLAWAGKEACYNTPGSGWLVVRYIADAMIAFGIAFPDGPVVLLESPTVEPTNGASGIATR